MSPEEFRRVRKAARMTQAQIAERLGVSRVTIVNWEAGKFNIPDDALLTLQEKGVAKTPAICPVTPKTHPEFYDPGKLKNTFARNHKHPHWFVTASWLGSFMTEAQKTEIDSLVCTTEDIARYPWTPETAIAFVLSFNGAIGWGGNPMSQKIAEEICRRAGFDIPLPAVDVFNRAHNQWLMEHGTLAGFYDAHPEFERPAVPVETPEQRAASEQIQRELDAAFKLNGETK